MINIGIKKGIYDQLKKNFSQFVFEGLIYLLSNYIKVYRIEFFCYGKFLDNLYY